MATNSLLHVLVTMVTYRCCNKTVEDGVFVHMTDFELHVPYTSIHLHISVYQYS